MGKRAGLFSFILSIFTSAYTIAYMRYANPVENDGAMSKIGLAHKGEFIIWGVLTFLSLATGICLAYKNTTKTKIHIPLLCTSATGMAMTLIFDFNYDVKPDYYLHCVGSLLFSVVMGATIFLLYLLNYRKSTLYKFFTYISAGVLIADFVLLLIFKETGLIETVPIFTGYILLAITNLRRNTNELTV